MFPDFKMVLISRSGSLESRAPKNYGVIHEESIFGLVSLFVLSDNGEYREIGVNERVRTSRKNTVVHVLEGADNEKARFCLEEGDYGYRFGDGCVLSVRYEKQDGTTIDLGYEEFLKKGAPTAIDGDGNYLESDIGSLGRLPPKKPVERKKPYCSGRLFGPVA